jgi:hypothetical protein
MFSSAYSVEVAGIGRAFQGGGNEDDRPWFIMITKVHPDTLDEVMWFHPATESLITEIEYANISQPAPSGDSDAESVGDIAQG